MITGNPWPPMPSPTRHNANSLVNVLLSEAKKDYRAKKYKDYSEMRELLMEQRINEQVSAAEAVDSDQSAFSSHDANDSGSQTVTLDADRPDKGSPVDKTV